MALALAVTTVVTIGASSPISSSGSGRRNGLFGVVTNSRPSSSSISSSSSSSSGGGGGGNNSNIRHFPSSILSARGGDATNDIDAGETKNMDGDDDGVLAVDEQSLYFPGLLDASVVANGRGSGGHRTTAATNALSDCYISIAQSKARELRLRQGELVGIMGKRRRCAYVKVNILQTDRTTTTTTTTTSSSSAVIIGRNLANNLRIRNDDKVRIISVNEIEENENEDQQQQNGSYGLGKRPTIVAKTVTFHPIKDTMSNNVDDYDDDVSNEELISRFITPYLESSSADDVDNDENENVMAIMKEGHVLSLTDDNGNVMEFTIGKLDVDHDENNEDDEEKDETGECSENIYI